MRRARVTPIAFHVHEARMAPCLVSDFTLHIFERKYMRAFVALIDNIHRHHSLSCCVRGPLRRYPERVMGVHSLS